MKYELNDEQVEYVLRDSYVSVSDYVNTLNAEEEEKYLSIYAALLVEKIVETEDQAVEAAKEAIAEYYDYQELHDEGYWYPSSEFTDEDQENLDNCDANAIDYDKWVWENSNLLNYIVDSEWTHSSKDYGLVQINDQQIYFDRYLTRNEKVAETVEELAKKYFFKQALENKLECHEEKYQKRAKI